MLLSSVFLSDGADAAGRFPMLPLHCTAPRSDCQGRSCWLDFRTQLSYGKKPLRDTLLKSDDAWCPSYQLVFRLSSYFLSPFNRLSVGKARDTYTDYTRDSSKATENKPIFKEHGAIIPAPTSFVNLWQTSPRAAPLCAFAFYDSYSTGWLRQRQ